jgi:hypothetical protein
VGIGNNNFPALWFLAAAITAIMLWLLADDSSSLIGKNGELKSLGGSDAQILAGILLVVPALVSALAIGSNDVPLPDGGANLVRGILAVYLFVLTVAASVIGNDRAAMKVDRSRHYITVSFLAVGVICMALAFVEMRGAIAKPTSLQATAELAAVPLLLLMPLAGEALYQVTRWPGIKPAEDEVHVSPIVGQAMLKGERVLEFSVLREREEQAKKKQKEDEKRAEGKNEPFRTEGGPTPP